MEHTKITNLWKHTLLALAFCLLLFLVISPVVGKTAPENPASGSNQFESREKTINVTGTADVMIAPDEVDITVSIETRNESFRRAKSENDDNAKKVIQLAKKYGIDAKHVQSDYIRTYPNYVYENHTETNKISYYNVQKRIVIKLKDIDKFEDLVSDLTVSEKIMVENIEFRSSELAKYKNEARKLAARVAKEKAELITSELGSNVGVVLTINEEQIDNYTWWGRSWYRYGYYNPGLSSNVSVNYQDNQEGSGSDQSGETISIGQIKITARISVVFEIN